MHHTNLRLILINSDVTLVRVKTFEANLVVIHPPSRKYLASTFSWCQPEQSQHLCITACHNPIIAFKQKGWEPDVYTTTSPRLESKEYNFHNPSYGSECITIKDIPPLTYHELV